MFRFVVLLLHSLYLVYPPTTFSLYTCLMKAAELREIFESYNAAAAAFGELLRLLLLLLWRDYDF